MARAVLCMSAPAIPTELVPMPVIDSAMQLASNMRICALLTRTTAPQPAPAALAASLYVGIMPSPVALPPLALGFLLLFCAPPARHPHSWGFDGM